MSPVRLEHATLVALAAVLPLFEFWKGVFWLLFVVLWIVNRARAREFGGPWDHWDTLIALWIASTFAAAVFAGLPGNEWGATRDVMRYTSVLWLMKRSSYPERVLVAIVVAIVAGTLVTLAWGYYGILVSGERQTLGLKSVGHVNHSAIYLAIAFGAALIATRAWWRATKPAWRSAGLVCTLIFAVSLFVMQSRAAVGAAIIVALVLLFAYAVRRRHSLRPLALGVAVALAIGLAAKPQVLEKNQDLVGQDLFLSRRDGIWLSGLLAWREYPVFGVGMDNWKQISADRLRAWAERRSEPLDQGRLQFSSHGHSLYINTLVERGVAGFAALAAILIAWLLTLARHPPQASAPPVQWSYWGGAAAAWLVAVTVGVVNTTLHHEHALVSMLLLGGWLSLARRS